MAEKKTAAKGYQKFKVDLPFRQKEAKAFEKLNQSIEKVNKTFGNVTW